MFHHDLALSGVSSSTAPNTNDTLWIYPTGSPVASSPAIVDGILYVGCTDSNLYALDAETGALMWTYPTHGPINSSPAVADGKVYFLSTDGNIYAIDAITGAFVWNAFFGFGSFHWSSPAIHDGKVFIGASNGWIHSLDAGTGTTIWSTPIGGQPNSPITVVNGKVYSGTHNFVATFPTLVALDENTGAVIWTYNHTDWYPQTVGMINCNGVAVVDGNEDGRLEVYFGIVTWGQPSNEAICLDEATGNPIWTYNLNGWSTSTPAVHDGKVFIGSDDGNLYALNADTGSLFWAYPTGGQILAAPAVADGKVFFGSLNHIFYAVDEATGNLVWSYNTGLSRIMGSPGVADGKVFVGNENGKIYAFGHIEVYVDIKPGSWPNPINVKSKGVFAVAICGTCDFDVRKIDPATIKIYSEDVEEGAAPLRWSYEDVATPYTADADGGHALGGDGYLDLVLHFDTQTTAAIVTLTDEAHAGQTIPLIIRGNLYKAFGGTPIQGQDYVRIIKPKT
jgi:outer membrane protein assembly factor BamB